MIRPKRSLSRAVVLAASYVLFGCKEEIKVIYAERIGIFPDASGIIVKEIRSGKKGQGQLVLLEAVGRQNLDILAAQLIGFDDVKFRSTVSNDTLILYHTEPRLDSGLSAIAKASFPIRFERVTGTRFLTVGTEEGAAIFYAPEKWKAYLELGRKK